MMGNRSLSFWELCSYPPRGISDGIMSVALSILVAGGLVGVVVVVVVVVVVNLFFYGRGKNSNEHTIFLIITSSI